MKRNNNKLIWIDLDNSPHVLFFNPIISELKRRGINVIITARDYAQVIELCKIFNIEYIQIGRHSGKSKIRKLLGLIIRAFHLVRVILKEKPDLALSHGSRCQILAAKMMGIQSATAIDYEYTEHIPFLTPDILFIPQIINHEIFNLNSMRIIKYPGIKEDVYVPYFKPDPKFRNSVKFNVDNIVITIRPPATLAHYHTLKSDELFDELLRFLAKTEGIVVILTPRTEEQANELRNKWKNEFRLEKFNIPAKVINGLDLIWISDLVVSGGGTMIREAAALGVPAYSIFGGEPGAVDRFLENSGRLTFIRNSNDLTIKMEVVKRNQNKFSDDYHSPTLIFIADELEGVLSTKS